MGCCGTEQSGQLESTRERLTVAMLPAWQRRLIERRRQGQERTRVLAGRRSEAAQPASSGAIADESRSGEGRGAALRPRGRRAVRGGSGEGLGKGVQGEGGAEGASVSGGANRCEYVTCGPMADALETADVYDRAHGVYDRWDVDSVHGQLRLRPAAGAGGVGVSMSKARRYAPSCLNGRGVSCDTVADEHAARVLRLRRELGRVEGVTGSGPSIGELTSEWVRAHPDLRDRIENARVTHLPSAESVLAAHRAGAWQPEEGGGR